MLHTIKGNLKRAAGRGSSYLSISGARAYITISINEVELSLEGVFRNEAYGQKCLWEGLGHSELLFHAVPTQSL